MTGVNEMPEQREEKRVSDIMKEVAEEFCNGYCRFPFLVEDEEELYSKHCEKCPINKLF